MPTNRPSSNAPRLEVLLELLNPLLKPMRAEYLKFRKSPIPGPTHEVFTRYEKQGGNVETLWFLLWLLSFKKRTEHGGIIFEAIQSRTLKARLAHCEASLQELIDVLPGFPPRLYSYLKKTLQEVQQVSQSPAAQQKICGFGGKQASGKAGRKKGVTLDSLILALIAYELRSRFGEPCSGDILTLIHTAAPEKFPTTVTTKHLRGRIKSVPVSEVKYHHAALFPSP